MSVTRRMLSAMEIPEDKIDQIVSEHKTTVDELVAERDKYKNQVAELEDLRKNLDKANKDLDAANAELEKIKINDWENKYTKIKDEYDSFKTETTNKEIKAKKTEAYKKLLKDAGVSEKRISSVIKVSDVDSIKLDSDGNIEGADKLTENVKEEWSDFIVTKQERGFDVSNPPANNGNAKQNQPSRAAQMVAQYRNEHYGNAKEE